MGFGGGAGGGNLLPMAAMAGGGGVPPQNGPMGLKEVGRVRNIFPETWLWTNQTTE